jgi:F-type H+-transporting ATPase subunit gamma
MADNLKDIRRRVRSVRNTRQITRAMEMVSAAKLRRTSVLFEAAKPYSEKMKQLLSRVVSAELLESHPYFQVRPIKRILLVVFTADKGLCGSFNANLISKAEQFCNSQSPDVEVDLFIVGRKAWDYFRRRDYKIVGSCTNLSGRPDNEVARSVVDRAASGFSDGTYDSVSVIYANYINKMTNRPFEEVLLPLASDVVKSEDGEEASSEADYIIEPDAASVFDSLIPRFLQGRMYGVMVETFTCEHSARMVAMTNATQNCKELMDALTLKMNKARQSSITTDLLDIVGGAEALSE